MRNLFLAAGSLAIALGGSAFIALASITAAPVPTFKGQDRVSSQSHEASAVDIRACSLADWSHVSGPAAIDTTQDGCSVVSQTVLATDRVAAAH